MYPPLGSIALGLQGPELPLPGKWLRISPYVLYLPKATVKLGKSVKLKIDFTLTVKNSRRFNTLIYSNVKWVKGEESLDHVLHSFCMI